MDTPHGLAAIFVTKECYKGDNFDIIILASTKSKTMEAALKEQNLLSFRAIIFSFNSTALRKAKIIYNFGLSESNIVKRSFIRKGRQKIPADPSDLPWSFTYQAKYEVIDSVDEFKL